MQVVIRYFVLILIFLSCSSQDKNEPGDPVTSISTGTVTPAEVVAYARTLTGCPYKYGSIDPEQGFDCSGFITYVFYYFCISVPRSSVEFTNVGHEISLNDARPGDLVLFTGTDTTSTIVGHMGIMVSSPGEEPRFIHSTSGRAMGVTETTFYSYYVKRYVKTIRIFPQNDLKMAADSDVACDTDTLTSAPVH